MSDHLRCGVCEQPYTAGVRRPKFLQCTSGLQHTVCLSCVGQLITSGEVCCPSCGDLTTISEAEQLADNIYLMPQIQAEAAAARLRGEEQFCRTCVSLAGAECNNHDVVPAAEARESLAALAQTVAEKMEQIRHNRSVPLRLYQSAHAVLQSAAQAVQRVLEDFDLDVQMDDDALQEMERCRQLAHELPLRQLEHTFALVTSHLAPTDTSLRESTQVAQQCEALLDSKAQCSALGGIIKTSFTTGEWLADGNLTKAVLAAAIVYFSLDSETRDNNQDTGESGKGATAGKMEHRSVAPVPAPVPVAAKDNVTVPQIGKTNVNSNTKTAVASKKAAGSLENNANKNLTKTPGSDIPLVQLPSGANSSKQSVTLNAKTAVVTPNKLTATTANKSGSSVNVLNAITATSKVSVKPLSFSTAVKKSKSSSDVAAAAASAVPSRPLQSKLPQYVLQLAVGDATAEVIIELRKDMAPIMCDNFMLLCDGGFYNDSKFHFSVPDDQLVGGKMGPRLRGGEGFSPLAPAGKDYVMADLCPLQDEAGAIRMKCMETIDEENGRKRGFVGSQFMIWASETRDYHIHLHTLVFGFVRHGMEVVRDISRLERVLLRRKVRITSAHKRK